MFTEATYDDCEAIAAFAQKTFIDTFGHLYRPENRAAHVAEKFSTEFFIRALESGDTIVMLHDEARLIGYAKVGHLSLPVKPPIPLVAAHCCGFGCVFGCVGRKSARAAIIYALWFRADWQIFVSGGRSIGSRDHHGAYALIAKGDEPCLW